jgi:methyl-accepting chemotaxis protein
MDGMTQQNAALVEQAAAAAQSMQDQAATLAQSVSIFKLSQDDRQTEPARALRLALV